VLGNEHGSQLHDRRLGVVVFVVQYGRLPDRAVAFRLGLLRKPLRERIEVLFLELRVGVGDGKHAPVCVSCRRVNPMAKKNTW